MTPSEVNNAARDIYNAASDTFFTDAQMYNWQWQACHELAKKAWIIERTYTASTVASTQDYAYPTNTIAIKRLTVNGRKLKRATHREDDALTLSNQASVTTGWPIYYTDFNFIVSLRPIPDTVYTLKIYSYNLPTVIDSNSTALEIPTLFHFDLVDYLLWRMFEKDKDITTAQLHRGVWLEHVQDAVSWQRRKRRTDSFATVQNEETLPATILGEA